MSKRSEVHIAVCGLIILMVDENVPQPLPPSPPPKKRKTTARNNKNGKKSINGTNTPK